MPKPSRKTPTSRKVSLGAGRASASKRKGKHIAGGFYHVEKKAARVWKPIEKYPYPKGTLPKDVQRKVERARQYKRSAQKRKTALSRRYNAELERLMRKDYSKDDIARAKKYTATGKAIRIKAAAVNVRRSSDGKKVYVLLPKGTRKAKSAKRVSRGSFRGRVEMSHKAFAASMRMIVYNARIRHYQTLYGLSRKEAQGLYRSLKDEKFGAAIFKALY